MQVDLDKEHSAELYQAVAEILAFVYYLERQAKGSSQNVDDLLAQAGQALTLPLPVALPAAADSATPATPPTPRWCAHTITPRSQPVAQPVICHAQHQGRRAQPAPTRKMGVAKALKPGQPLRLADNRPRQSAARPGPGQRHAMARKT